MKNTHRPSAAARACLALLACAFATVGCAQSPAAPEGAVPGVVMAPGQAAPVQVAPPPPPPPSRALVDARKRVTDIGYEISRTESEQRRLSPPIRTRHTDGRVTFDEDKQRTFEVERSRYDRKIRDLRDERRDWEMRVNQLLLQEQAPRY